MVAGLSGAEAREIVGRPDERADGAAVPVHLVVRDPLRPDQDGEPLDRPPGEGVEVRLSVRFPEKRQDRPQVAVGKPFHEDYVVRNAFIAVTRAGVPPKR